MKENIDLDQLLAGSIPETSWSLDTFSNLWAINVETREADVVAHLCELPEKNRREIVDAYKALLDTKQYECDYIEGKYNSKNFN